MARGALRPLLQGDKQAAYDRPETLAQVVRDVEHRKDGAAVFRPVYVHQNVLDVGRRNGHQEARKEPQGLDQVQGHSFRVVYFQVDDYQRRDKGDTPAVGIDHVAGQARSHRHTDGPGRAQPCRSGGPVFFPEIVGNERETDGINAPDADFPRS